MREARREHCCEEDVVYGAHATRAVECTVRYTPPDSAAADAAVEVRCIATRLRHSRDLVDAAIGTDAHAAGLLEYTRMGLYGTVPPRQQQAALPTWKPFGRVDDYVPLMQHRCPPDAECVELLPQQSFWRLLCEDVLALADAGVEADADADADGDADTDTDAADNFASCTRRVLNALALLPHTQQRKVVWPFWAHMVRAVGPPGMNVVGHAWALLRRVSAAVKDAGPPEDACLRQNTAQPDHDEDVPVLHETPALAQNGRAMRDGTVGNALMGRAYAAPAPLAVSQPRNAALCEGAPWTTAWPAPPGPAPRQQIPMSQVRSIEYAVLFDERSGRECLRLRVTTRGNPTDELCIPHVDAPSTLRATELRTVWRYTGPGHTVNAVVVLHNARAIARLGWLSMYRWWETERPRTALEEAILARFDVQR